MVERGASLLTKPRCVPVKQFEAQLTGLVLAAAQGDRLRLHHRPRIRQVRTHNRPAYSNLSKIMISEVSEVQRSVQQSISIHDSLLEIFHKLKEWAKSTNTNSRHFAFISFSNFLPNLYLVVSTTFLIVTFAYVGTYTMVANSLYELELAQFNIIQHY